MRLISTLIICFFSMGLSADVNIDRMVKDDWLEVKSDNFTIITDESERVAQRLAQDLEKFRHFLIYMQNGRTVVDPLPLRILAVDSRRNFRALDFPSSVGGVFVHRNHEDFAVANISDFSLRESKPSWGNQILLHEYVHFAARTMLGTTYYPLWYSEGEADYYGTFRFTSKGETVRLGDLSVIGNRSYSLRNSFGRVKSFDVQELFKIKRNPMFYPESDMSGCGFYARSMYTYHYLSSSQELIKKRSHYLNLVNRGMDVDTAFKFAFDMSWEEIESEVFQYTTSKVNVWEFKVGDGGIHFPEFAVSVRELTPGEVRSEITAVVSRMGVYKKEDVNALISTAHEKGAPIANLSIAEIDWLIASGQDPSEAMSRAQSLYPHDPIVRAYAAYLESQKVMYLLGLDCADSKAQLVSLRNNLRTLISEDPYNRMAYLTLGTLSTSIVDTDPALLREAAIMLDSAKLLMPESERHTILPREMRVATLLEDPDALLRFKHQFSSISDSPWIRSGYGRFVQEMLELRLLGITSGEIHSSSISYADGSRYEGEIQGGLPNGLGTLTMYYGAKLFGTFVAGKLDGHGELESSTGFHYIGDFKESIITGEGQLDYPVDEEVSRVTGAFIMGQENGLHKVEYSDGSVAELHFVAGTRHGQFSLTSVTGDRTEREFYMGHMYYSNVDGVKYLGDYSDEFMPTNGFCQYLETGLAEACSFVDGEFVAVTYD